jgi:tetratricopeptide (TPR) repeat protein
MSISLQNINLYLSAVRCFILSFFLLFLPLISYSSQLFYTIQAGSFIKVAAAQKQFNSIVQKLNKKELDNLRIEKIGELYSVRLGKFKDYPDAEKFLKSIKTRLSRSIVMEVYIKDERIIKLYTASSSVDKQMVKEKPLSSPLPKKIKPQLTEKADKKIKTEVSALAHEKKGDKYVTVNRFLMATEEYRQAINQGINDPNLFRELALILYKTGFVDEAIVEMEKAVNLSPYADILRIELGILYFAKDRLEKAKEQFFAALKINPGLTHAYYYLGELFLRTGDYDMAWLCVNMAKRYGYKGQDIIRKLSVLSKEPDVDLWNKSEEDVYIRQIFVDDYKKAENIVDRISGGELFEDIAFKESLGPNANVGGFMGHLSLSDMDPKFANVLREREVLADPVIVETKRGFHIIQRIVPFDFNLWKKLLADSDKPKK